MTAPSGFDARAFFAAVEERRVQEQLSWRALAQEIWEQSCVLNDRRLDHPISPATIRKMGASGLSCQHALFVLRWLDVPPETFIAVPAPGTSGVPLPQADAAHRLRWDLKELYSALNDARTARGATWEDAAQRLHCGPSQLTGLRTAKFAIAMRLAMRITQALRRPAADFVYVAEW
ncbi:MAG TPA: hypothetical protein VF741_04705 [Candidatus Aquilonibacter sp.]